MVLFTTYLELFPRVCFNIQPFIQEIFHNYLLFKIKPFSDIFNPKSDFFEKIFKTFHSNKKAIFFEWFQDSCLRRRNVHSVERISSKLNLTLHMQMKSTNQVGGIMKILLSRNNLCQSLYFVAAGKLQLII